MRRGFLVTDEGNENEDFTFRYAAMGDSEPASIEEPEDDEEEDDEDDEIEPPSKDDETDDEEEDEDETETVTQPDGVKSPTE